jgi:phage shock protein PspC (stress-responsive transcriptional regulator)
VFVIKRKLRKVRLVLNNKNCVVFGKFALTLGIILWSLMEHSRVSRSLYSIGAKSLSEHIVYIICAQVMPTDHKHDLVSKTVVMMMMAEYGHERT